MKQRLLSGILAGIMVSTVMPMAVTAEKSSDPRIQFGEAYYANDSKTVKITVSSPILAEAKAASHPA